MPVIGGEALASNIAAFGGGFIKHVNKTMKDVSVMLDEEITKNMSHACHSLSDLRRMGHPYGKSPNPNREPIPHTPDWVIHKQSGKLISSKKRGIEEGSINFGQLRASAYVGLDESIAPHVLPVIYGSWKMIPRDFMTESLNIVKNPALLYLKDNLKDFVFNFRDIKK